MVIHLEKKVLSEKQYRGVIAFVVVMNIILAAVVVCAVTQQFQNTTVDHTTPKFILASWDYPDEYGQGVYALRVYENSTGSWVSASGWIDYYETVVLEWEGEVAIKIKCLSTINATLTGASSSYAGRLYIRHNVTVTNSLDAVVFSKQNFTFLQDVDYEYEHEVILNFLPLFAEHYTVSIICEIFY